MAGCLIFGLLSYFLCTNNKGSGGCAGSPEPSLVTCVISTIISWAGSLIIVEILKFEEYVVSVWGVSKTSANFAFIDDSCWCGLENGFV